jgi:hypothetical protein
MEVLMEIFLTFKPQRGLKASVLATPFIAR